MSKQIWEEVMDAIVEDGTAVANSTTETILFPDVTVPAKYMGADRLLLYEAYGRYSGTGTPTMRFRLRWGGVAGTVIFDTGTITVGAPTAAMWRVKVYVQGRAQGVTAGSIFAVGEVTIGGTTAPTVASATGAPAIALGGSAGLATPAAVGSLNTFIDQALSLTLQWSAASASNTATGHFRVLRSLN